MHIHGIFIATSNICAPHASRINNTVTPLMTKTTSTKSTVLNTPKQKKFHAEEYLDLMAPLTGVPIDEAWMPIVCAHLTTAAKMADIVNSAPIDTNTVDIANTYSLD